MPAFSLTNALARADSYSTAALAPKPARDVPDFRALFSAPAYDSSKPDNLTESQYQAVLFIKEAETAAERKATEIYDKVWKGSADRSVTPALIEKLNVEAGELVAQFRRSQVLRSKGHYVLAAETIGLTEPRTQIEKDLAPIVANLADALVPRPGPFG